MARTPKYEQRSALSCAVLIPVRLRSERYAERVALLVKALESVIEARKCYRSDVDSSPVAIILIDDYSTVPLWQTLPQEITTQVSIWRNLGTRGQGGALNSVISRLDCDHLLFTDSDCIVQHDWVFVALRSLRSEAQLDAIAGPNWQFQTPIGWWQRFLTRNESLLMRHVFVRSLSPDEKLVQRVDLRNFGARLCFLREIPFPEGVISVSGFYSYLLQKRTRKPARIRYQEDMIAKHACVTSLRAQISTYFRRAYDVNVVAIYTRGFSRTLLKAFFDQFAARHFVDPIKRGVSPVYVTAVHGAFWLGLACWTIKRWVSER